MLESDVASTLPNRPGGQRRATLRHYRQELVCSELPRTTPRRSLTILFSIATLERRLGDQPLADPPEDNDASMTNSSPPAVNNDIAGSNSANEGSGSNSTSEPPSAGDFGGHVGFDNTSWDSTEILSGGNWEFTGPFTQPEPQVVDMALPGIDAMTTVPGSEPGVIPVPTNAEDLGAADALSPLTRADL